jgi:threonine dehydrogenase-like Zn-dependent dehydrogenase
MRRLWGRPEGIESDNHLNTPQNSSNRFPIVLGREFCGEVLDASPDLLYTYPVGSKVVGYLKPHQSGAISECIHAPGFHCGPLPTNLSPVVKHLEFIFCEDFSGGNTNGYES